MLKVGEVSASYGTMPVLHEVSLEVNEGEIVSLIGANSAGKSTLLKTMVGLVRPTSGAITFEGVNLTGLFPQQIAGKGIILVPEGRQLFPDMSVEENLLVGAYNPRAKLEREVNFKRVYQLFPVLQERKKQQASTLSGGEQQMLAVGRALMAKPRILLLDEPSLGLAPILVMQIFDALQELNRQGLTILIVEQNVELSLKVSARGYVLLHGRIFLSGASQPLLQDDRVRKAYLGIAE